MTLDQYRWTLVALTIAVLLLASACAPTSVTKETTVIREVSDNGCRIGTFETSTGPRGRSAIIVECK